MTAIAALERSLPSDYIEFASSFDGGEGFIGDHYLVLWRVAELAALNREYEFSEYAPDLLAFGSDGGGEAFAFDTRTEPASVVIVPFIGMSYAAATPVTASFNEFLIRLRDDPRSFWET
jgi:hypothetical protein